MVDCSFDGQNIMLVFKLYVFFRFNVAVVEEALLTADFVEIIAINAECH